MPSFHEVRSYLYGIWLLIKGDPRGVHLLDTSERGMWQSFWAILWCLPAFAVYCVIQRMDYVSATGPDGQMSTLPYVTVLAAIEAMRWIIPPVLIAWLCFALKLRPQLRVLIVVFNWSTLPIFVINAIVLLLFLLPLQHEEFAMQFWLGQLAIFLIFGVLELAATVRAFRNVIGGYPFKALALAIPGVVLLNYLAVTLEKAAGIHIDY